MKSLLSDTEFKDLAALGFGAGAVLHRSKVAIPSVQRSLLNKSLVEFERKRVPASTIFGDSAEDWFALKVSGEGYRVLQEDPFRLATTLIDLGLYQYISAAIWRLSKDQLPVVLACEDERARKAAIDRLEELEGGGAKWFCHKRSY